MSVVYLTSSGLELIVIRCDANELNSVITLWYAFLSQYDGDKW